MLTYVVGFFATAGAAGVDFGMNNRDKKDVSMGGLVGIALAIICHRRHLAAHRDGRCPLRADLVDAPTSGKMTAALASKLIPSILAYKAKWVMFALAIAAFPPACFSSFIAANSFKTTLPKVNPFISVGIGTVVSIILAVTGVAGKADGRVRDHRRLLWSDLRRDDGGLPAQRQKWSGPRAGFNPAGWIAWAAGFVVGILPNLGVNVPAAPVLAFVVGAVVYFLCAKMGMLSPVVPRHGALAEATK